MKSNKGAKGMEVQELLTGFNEKELKATLDKISEVGSDLKYVEQLLNAVKYQAKKHAETIRYMSEGAIHSLVDSFKVVEEVYGQPSYVDTNNNKIPKEYESMVQATNKVINDIYKNEKDYSQQIFAIDVVLRDVREAVKNLENDIVSQEKLKTLQNVIEVLGKGAAVAMLRYAIENANEASKKLDSYAMTLQKAVNLQEQIKKTEFNNLVADYPGMRP